MTEDGTAGLATSTRDTLGARLSKRDNALNLVRLILASAVVLGHAWPLTGSDTQPPFEFVSGIAVNGFFAASGYLIAGSRVRLAFGSYLWRRVLRIFPGFLVCLLVISTVFGPLAALLEGNRYNWHSAFNFLYRNAFLQIQQWGIDGTLDTVPYKEAWNGSLWTLFFEFVAYVLIGVLLTGRWMRHVAIIVVPVVFLLVVFGRVTALGPLDVTTNLYLNGLRLGGYFLAGAVLYLIADRLTFRPRYILAAAAVYLVLWHFGAAELFGQLPLAYLVLSIGAIGSTGLATRNDLSYGVYIYAFPIQQLLVLLGTAPWGIIANTLLTLGITFLFAGASWFFIEKPALALKGIRFAVPW